VDLYAALGLDRGADASAIKNAYKARAKKCHPDTGGDAEQFRAVQMAYDVLIDPERRERYDRTGECEDRPIDNRMSMVALMVSSALGLALQECDQRGVAYAHENLVARMTKVLQTKKFETRTQAEPLEKHIANLKDVQTRFLRKRGGSGLSMAEVIGGQIGELGSKLAALQTQLACIEDALAIVSGHTYRTDPAPKSQRANTMFDPRPGNFIFTQFSP
jgi:curved DNA-binding protein CbpA